MRTGNQCNYSKVDSQNVHVAKTILSTGRFFPLIMCIKKQMNICNCKRFTQKSNYVYLQRLSIQHTFKNVVCSMPLVFIFIRHTPLILIPWCGFSVHVFSCCCSCCCSLSGYFFFYLLLFAMQKSLRLQWKLSMITTIIIMSIRTITLALHTLNVRTDKEI